MSIQLFLVSPLMHLPHILKCIHYCNHLTPMQLLLATWKVEHTWKHLLVMKELQLRQLPEPCSFLFNDLSWYFINTHLPCGLDFRFGEDWSIHWKDDTRTLGFYHEPTGFHHFTELSLGLICRIVGKVRYFVHKITCERWRTGDILDIGDDGFIIVG